MTQDIEVLRAQVAAAEERANRAIEEQARMREKLTYQLVKCRALERRLESIQRIAK